MLKLPAFLFYDGDAARDVSHMNRLERGCYFDLIQAQLKFGGYTIKQIQKILGKDFESCWEALALILTNNNDIYYIEWVKNSIEKREKFNEHQRENINKRWNKDDTNVIPNEYQTSSKMIPLENEDEDSIIKGVQGENKNGCITLKLFDTFWKIYPKKIDKGKALSKWTQLCNKKDKRPTWKEIRVALHYQMKSERWQDKTFIPHPTTWLNQSRWLDDPKEMKVFKRDDEKEKFEFVDNVKYICKEGRLFHAVTGEYFGLSEKK